MEAGPAATAATVNRFSVTQGDAGL